MKEQSNKIALQSKADHILTYERCGSCILLPEVNLI